jgi:hypothetical protein
MTCVGVGVGKSNGGEGARRLGGKPDLALPEGWQVLTAKTGVPPGIDKGSAYAPGLIVARIVAELAPMLEMLPDRPSIDLIQSWLKMGAFADWFASPVGLWPVARLPTEISESIGPNTVVTSLSPQSIEKQIREHPELTALDYLMVQRTIDQATHKVLDTPRSMIFALEDENAAGYALVVKATISGKGLFITSFRRLSSRQVDRDRAIKNLMNKQME